MSKMICNIFKNTYNFIVIISHQFGKYFYVECWETHE